MYRMLEPFVLPLSYQVFNSSRIVLISTLISELSKNLGLLPWPFESNILIHTFQCKRFHILLNINKNVFSRATVELAEYYSAQ